MTNTPLRYLNNVFSTASIRRKWRNWDVYVDILSFSRSLWVRWDGLRKTVGVVKDVAENATSNLHRFSRNFHISILYLSTHSIRIEALCGSWIASSTILSAKYLNWLVYNCMFYFMSHLQYKSIERSRFTKQYNCMSRGSNIFECGIWMKHAVLRHKLNANRFEWRNLAKGVQTQCPNGCVDSSIPMYSGTLSQAKWTADIKLYNTHSLGSNTNSVQRPAWGSPRHRKQRLEQNTYKNQYMNNFI